MQKQSQSSRKIWITTSGHELHNKDQSGKTRSPDCPAPFTTTGSFHIYWSALVFFLFQWEMSSYTATDQIIDTEYCWSWWPQHFILGDQPNIYFHHWLTFCFLKSQRKWQWKNRNHQFRLTTSNILFCQANRADPIDITFTVACVTKGPALLSHG